MRRLIMDKSIINEVFFNNSKHSHCELPEAKASEVLFDEMENIICPLCGDGFPIEYGEPDDSGAIICPKCSAKIVNLRRIK